MGIILLALSMSGPVFIIVSFTRLALWNVASQVCWDVDNFGPYCVLQGIFYIYIYIVSFFILLKSLFRFKKTTIVRTI